MSELCTVASIAKKEKISFISDNKKELLRKLQGRIHFERILSVTNVSLRGRSTLALPAWFVRKHGDKFRKYVILRSGSSTKSWPVNVTISCRSPADTQVRFLGGWNAFVTFHGLQQGDSLVFSLTAMSEFDVYIIPGTRNLKGCTSPARPRKWSDGSELSGKRTKQVPLNENKNEEVLIDDGSVEGEVKSNEVFLTEIVEKERVVSESGHSSTSCSLSSNNQDLSDFESENMRDSSSRDHHDSAMNRQGPALGHVELMVSNFTGNGRTEHIDCRKYTENVYQGSAPQKIIKLLEFPGFSKKLTITNVFNQAYLVIPPYFWRTYSSRLHSVIKLQGIHEESKVRTAPCVLPNHGKQTRIYLRAGWKQFSDENNLEVGQELLFSLTADSFFVVRNMLSPSRNMPREEATNSRLTQHE